LKYRYVGPDSLILVVNDKRVKVRRGQLVELPWDKVKTSKLRRYMKPAAEEVPTLTGDDVKKLKKLLKETHR